MTRPVYPPGVRFDSTDAVGCAVPRMSANYKKTTRPGESLSHNPADGSYHPTKVTLLPSVVNCWQKGPFSLRGYVGSPEDRLCEPRSPRLDHLQAMVASRFNPVTRDFNQRLLSAGKPKKLALTTCMRKLLIIPNSMLKYGSSWNHPATRSLTHSH